MIAGRPEHTGEIATMQTTFAAVRRWAALVPVAVAALFAIQNLQEAPVTVLAWTFRPPLVVVIIVSFALGVVMGWIYRPFRPYRPPSA